CSALLQSGAVFDLDDSATRRLVVSNSLVAAPPRKPLDAPVLIRQAGESNSFRFDCKRDALSRNCYYNLAAYVAKGQPAPARVARTFKHRAVAKGRTKTVDPTVTKSNNDVYPSLAQALGEAQPGDEILIKYNGPRPLAVAPVLLEKVADVTIKPFPEYRPVLTL